MIKPCNPIMENHTVTNMNSTKLWNGTIRMEDSKNKKEEKYVLYSTGYADLNGRKYQALPASLVITPEIKNKYNLM